MDKAKEFLLLSAKQGYDRAQSLLGTLYLNENNFKEAEYYLLLATKQNNLKAQFSLGYLYHKEGKIGCR